MTEEPEDAEAKEDVAVIHENMQLTANYLVEMFTEIKIMNSRHRDLEALAIGDGALSISGTPSSGEKRDVMDQKLQKGLEELLEEKTAGMAEKLERLEKMLEDQAALDIQVQIVGGDATTIDSSILERKFLCLTSWNGNPVQPTVLEVSAWSDQAEDDVLVDSVELKDVRVGKTLVKIPNDVEGNVFNLKVVLENGVERHGLVAFRPPQQPQ